MKLSENIEMDTIEIQRKREKSMLRQFRVNEAIQSTEHHILLVGP